MRVSTDVPRRGDGDGDGVGGYVDKKSVRSMTDGGREKSKRQVKSARQFT